MKYLVKLCSNMRIVDEDGTLRSIAKENVFEVNEQKDCGIDGRHKKSC